MTARGGSAARTVQRSLRGGGRRVGLALLASLALVAGGSGGASGMCANDANGFDTRAIIGAQKGPILRLIVTLRTAGPLDRGTLDRRTAALAAELTAGGALMASPISGQPLLVVEIDRGRLALLTGHPSVACIANDAADPPT